MLDGLGPRAPFFAGAALSLGNLAYGYFVLAESLPPELRRPFKRRRANPLGTLLHTRRHPVVLACSAGAVASVVNDAELNVLARLVIPLVEAWMRRLVTAPIHAR